MRDSFFLDLLDILDLLDCKSKNGCGRQGDGEFLAVLRGGEDGLAAHFERLRRDGDFIIIR
jgi:hypothetical protein